MADFGGDVETFRAEVREWLDANFPKSLAKDPANRYQTAQEMADDLRALLKNPSAPPWPGSNAPSRRCW